MSAEINILFPGREITLSSGETVTIKPFTFGQIPKAMKLAQKIGDILVTFVKEGSLGDKTKMAGLIMHVITEGGEDLLQLIALGIGKERAWFDTLQSDDGLNVTLAFMEENIDFFTKKMMPQLLEITQKLGKPKQ